MTQEQRLERLAALRIENDRLRRIVSDQMLAIYALKERIEERNLSIVPDHPSDERQELKHA